MRLLPLFVALFAVAPAFAKGKPPAASAKVEEKDPLEAKHGKIALGNNLAELNLPDNFGYLDPDQTEIVLVELWGNPPSKEKSLGMLIPMDTPLDAEDAWAVTIRYSNDGHVSDDDASDIDYDELLADMKEGAKAENEGRKAAGYPAIDIVGWAAQPHYDNAGKKLHWAKEVRFEGDKVSTLNYNIRVLGKEGVLVLNAIAPMQSLAKIEKQIPTIIGFTSFSQGNRYSEFDASTGRMAAYGVAGLVAGKVAAKAGFFVVLLKFLLAAKKLVIVGVIGIGAAISKLFGKKNDDFA
jgi:uncharacterized membrane-anchored protein